MKSKNLNSNTKEVPMKKFRLKLEIELWENEIWPDGDGPVDPDCEDVQETIRAYKSTETGRRGNIGDVVGEWNLDGDNEFTIEEIV